MSIYSNIDLETFQWVRKEVEHTLEGANSELEEFERTRDKSKLYRLGNHLHQVLGSLQMLELKSLSSLVLESERLVEDFVADKSDQEHSVSEQTFSDLIDRSFTALRTTFDRIESGLPENPVDVVELINKMRAERGLEDIDISSLFSPMIDVFPEVNSSKALKDKIYIKRAHALRIYFESFLLQWLRDEDDTALDKLALVIDKMLQMSTFGSVARLWWVASAYLDYIKHNDVKNTVVHGRVLRQLDDRFRDLETKGESGLVRDPGEELIRLMLFYVGVGEKRTERMDELVDAFKLQEYFPSLQLQESININLLEENLEKVNADSELPLTLVRRLVTSYFESEEKSTDMLREIEDQLTATEKGLAQADVGIVSDVVTQATSLIKSMRRGTVSSDDDTGFHLASALMFVENSITNYDEIDHHWYQNGQLKLHALEALVNQQDLTTEMDGTHLTGGERKALLDVVGNEVEENLKDIEGKLESFSKDPKATGLLEGIDAKIRQIRGALQVLGEQKVGLLLKMAEDQFVALANGESEAKPDLIEALAISVGTMEAYVQGLQSGRSGMDDLLDRSITDLEVAIGKTVSRADVEDLLDSASDSLFSWLSNQSDFELFTELKSSLRDLTILAKKTNLKDVSHLVNEQDRLVDVISQEPAFLTDNITANLQNNMASIALQIITLYGTDETLEEIAVDQELAYKKSKIDDSDDQDATRFHDEMDVDELDEELARNIQKEEDEPLNATEIGKQHAEDNRDAPIVDEAILEVFLEESREVLDESKIQLAACRSDFSDRNAVRELRRAFHTLKGSSRMVGLASVGEVAWFSESLFNYVLDTEKPLTPEMLDFADSALEEFESQLSNRYAKQHLIDIASWGEKTEEVNQLSRQDETKGAPFDAPKLEDEVLEDEVLEDGVLEDEVLEDEAHEDEVLEDEVLAVSYTHLTLPTTPYV